MGPDLRSLHTAGLDKYGWCQTLQMLNISTIVEVILCSEKATNGETFHGGTVGDSLLLISVYLFSCINMDLGD